MRDSQLLVLARAHFEEIVAEYPQMMQALAGVVVSRLRARERRLTFGQGGAERAHRVVGECTAVGELRSEERELLLERTRTDAQDHAPVAHDVERAVPLRDGERVVITENEHEGCEFDAGGTRREVPKGRQWVPIRAAAHFGHVDRHRHVLATRAEVVPEPLGLDDHALDLRDAGVDLPLRVRAGQPRDHRRHDAEAECCGCGHGGVLPRPDPVPRGVRCCSSTGGRDASVDRRG